MRLGDYIKQPDETESYSIDYWDNLSPTDHLVSSYPSIVNIARLAGEHVRSASCTAGVDDLFTRLVCSSMTLTIVAGMPDGAELYVCNAGTTGSVTVACSDLVDGAAGVDIPVNQGRVLVKSGGSWVTEARVDSIVVETPTDHRIRFWVGGGVSGRKYKVESTVTTNEGRIIQDEFIIRIKEY